MDDIIRALEHLFEQGRSAVLATIVRQAGPSPRGIGAKCLVMVDGAFTGSVGGGILEARTLNEAKRVFEKDLPARLYFSLEGTDVAETEMLCGGRVEVFLEPVRAGNPAAVALFQKIREDLRKGRPGLLITLMDPAQWEGGRVPKVFLRNARDSVGSLPGAGAVEAALFGKWKKGMAGRRLLVSQMTDDAGRAVEVLVEPVAARRLLYVFGAGHVSRQIVPLAARVGFRVVVVDDREDFADPALFPEATEVRCISFEGVMGQVPVDESSFVVIVTRGHVGDKTVLAQALGTRAAYIGMIGSRQKREAIYQSLLAEGFTQQDLERVHSPIGLPIGAETPEEIAVSIVAELIQTRAERIKPED
ncbi:MAG: hypothetical protein B5M55_06420 [Desulfococcus sp. 4484_242]|nr:MAG: hypothetical protein B5M55_06420 [Desulfococcus sp. 4484_242]